MGGGRIGGENYFFELEGGEGARRKMEQRKGGKKMRVCLFGCVFLSLFLDVSHGDKDFCVTFRLEHVFEFKYLGCNLY